MALKAADALSLSLTILLLVGAGLVIVNGRRPYPLVEAALEDQPFETAVVLTTVPPDNLAIRRVFGVLPPTAPANPVPARAASVAVAVAVATLPEGESLVLIGRSEQEGRQVWFFRGTRSQRIYAAADQVSERIHYTILPDRQRISDGECLHHIQGDLP